jgi:hypothetical protein
MTEPIQFEVTVDSIATRVDKSIKLTLSTQEMPDDLAGKLMTLRSKFLWVAFSALPLNYEDLDVPDVVTEFKNDKTPSARLRAVLFVLHKQRGETMDFDSWYKLTMNKIIDSYKELLEPE